jgi:hypothetical protein
MRRFLTVLAIAVVLGAGVFKFVQWTGKKPAGLAGPSSVFGPNIQLSGLSIESRAAKNPSGDPADRLSDDNPSIVGSLSRDFEFPNGAPQQTLSVDFKPVDSRSSEFALIYVDTNGRDHRYFATVDLNANKVTRQNGVVAMAPLGDGWHQITVTGAPPDASRLVRIQIYPDPSSAAGKGSLLLARLGLW